MEGVIGAEGPTVQDTQSPSSHTSSRPAARWSLFLRHAAQRWVDATLRTLNPFSHVPGVRLACPLEVASVCEAVIRSDAAGATATAALSLRGPDGAEHVLVFLGRSIDGNPRHAVAHARVDALQYLVESRPTAAAMTRLYVDDSRSRAEIEALLDSFPTLTLAGEPDPRLYDAANHTVVASDASIVPGTAGAGIAAVSGDGRIWKETLPETGDITWAELNAIRLALANTAGTERIVILSDSKGAVAFANGTCVPAQARMVRLAAQIQGLCAGRDVSIQWVRSHCGHALNEAADQAARAARRSLAPAAAAA